MMQPEDPCKTGWSGKASEASVAGAWSISGIQAGFLEEVGFQVTVGRRDKSGRAWRPCPGAG